METKYTSLIGNLGTLATLAPPSLPPSLPLSFFLSLSLSLSLSLARSLARSLCTSLLGGEVHLVDWNVQLYELLNRMSFSQHLTTLDLRLNQQLGAAQSLQFGKMKPFTIRRQAIVRFVDSPSLTPPVARSLKSCLPSGRRVCVTLGIIGILSDCFSFTVVFLVQQGRVALSSYHTQRSCGREWERKLGQFPVPAVIITPIRALLVPKTRNPAFAPVCSRQSRIGLWFRTTSLCRSVVRRFL